MIVYALRGFIETPFPAGFAWILSLLILMHPLQLSHAPFLCWSSRRNEGHDWIRVMPVVGQVVPQQKYNHAFMTSVGALLVPARLAKTQVLPPQGGDLPLPCAPGGTRGMANSQDRLEGSQVTYACCSCYGQYKSLKMAELYHGGVDNCDFGITQSTTVIAPARKQKWL